MSLLTTSPGGVERQVETCMGTVAIDGVNMHRLAWELFDLTALFGEPEQRGQNRMIPGVAGRIPYAPRVDETRLSLPYIVTGHWNSFDDWIAPGSVYTQLQANVAFLLGGVLEPTGVGDGTRDFVWTTPSGAVITAEVHILKSRPPIHLGTATQLRSLEILDIYGALHL